MKNKQEERVDPAIWTTFVCQAKRPDLLEQLIQSKPKAPIKEQEEAVRTKRDEMTAFMMRVQAYEGSEEKFLDEELATKH